MSPLWYGPAAPGDAGELARLEKVCFSCPRSEAALLSEIAQPERYLLLACKRQGVLEGYVGLERRGQGMGLRFLTLEVRPSNAAALGLYRGLGYWEAGRRKDFYTGPREDALLMTKYL